MHTQVGIIGAGPAGLVLSHLLHLHGVQSIVLEARSRDYVEERVRAGVLEHDTVELLIATGMGERLQRERLVHHGIELLFEGVGHRIPMTDLTGKTISLYGQREVVRDLIDGRLEADGQILFEAEATRVDRLTSSPVIHYTLRGRPQELECDFVAGCDGFHGVSRASIPPDHTKVYEHIFPLAWVGILAKVAPSTDELIYSSHDRGFALHSMRRPDLSRLYVQASPDDTLDVWPNSRIWDELQARLARKSSWSLDEGPVLEKVIAELRSFVVEPMQYGRLFLAGDAAHIVPATGAKGLNLAVADVAVLADALARWYQDGDRSDLDTYSERVLRRVWLVEQFSVWMTRLTHILPGTDPYERRIQLANLEYVATSEAAARSLAESYVGLDLVSSFLR